MYLAVGIQLFAGNNCISKKRIYTQSKTYINHSKYTFIIILMDLCLYISHNRLYKKYNCILL